MATHENAAEVKPETERVYSEDAEYRSEDSVVGEISRMIGIDPDPKTDTSDPVEEEVPEQKDQKAETEADAGDSEAEEAIDATSEEAEDDDWNLEYLASEFGVEVKDLYDTPLPMPDGIGAQEMTLGEAKDFVIKHHQLQKQLREKVQSLDNLDAEVKAAQLAYNEHAPEAQAAKTRMDELAQMWDQTAWDQLPEEQAKTHADQLRQAYQIAKVRHENATAAMSQYEGKIGQVKQQEEQARQEAWKQQAAEEWPKIQADNRWSNEEEASEGMQRYYKVMQDYGYSEEEARMATDHRVFKILKDAMDGRDAKSGVTKKRVKKVAKTVRGSKPTPKSVRQKRLQQRKMERAKKGDDEARVSLISELIS